MYSKPSITVVNLAVEHNSCDCASNLPQTKYSSKLNAAAATCGPAFMTTTAYTQ